MTGDTRVARSGMWRRHLRPAIIPATYADGFVIGSTMPTSTNTGVFADLPRLPYTGATVIDGSADANAPLLIESRDITDLLTIRSGYVKFFNCYFDSGPGTTDTGQVDCRGANVLGVQFERCTFYPSQGKRSFYLNALIGHHMTVRRCFAAGVVDFVGSYNTWATETNNVIEGNYLDWLVRYEVDHAHSDGTHNDGIQHQGGSGLTIRGNFLYGRMFYEDGVTIPSSSYGPLPAQGILVQQNVGFTNGAWVQGGGGTHPAINPVIENNWLRGWMHPIVIKTRSGGNHTAYSATCANNVLMDSNQRYYGTQMHYSVVGRPYLIRTDLGVTLNGKLTDPYTDGYPATGEPFPDLDDNVYANVTDVDSSMRGQPMTVRRDNFYGG